jgi:hypothetical protein
MGVKYSLPYTSTETISSQSNARPLNYYISNIDVSQYLDVSYNEYTVPGDYTITVPARASYIAAVLIGGGGGGGSGGWASNNGKGSGGGGGGSGGALLTKAISVSPGTTIYLTVGAGGTGGTVGASSGDTPQKIPQNNAVAGGDTTMSFDSKIYTAGGGGKGISGWNTDSDNLNGSPSPYTGNGGNRGTNTVSASSDISYNTRGIAGSSITFTSGTDNLSSAQLSGGAGGGRTENYSSYSRNYNAIGGAAPSIQPNTQSNPGNDGTGDGGAGGSGGSGNNGNGGDETKLRGGIGGKGADGYARIYFYI